MPLLRTVARSCWVCLVAALRDNTRTGLHSCDNTVDGGTIRILMEQSNHRMKTVPTNRFVVLLRVSTKSQGADGLGIAAQRRDIQLFLDQQENPEVVSELVEVQSGVSTDRPVLEKALNLCRQHHCSLLVQKVDRISRDMECLARIVKDKSVPIKVACLPQADNFQIHLYGALASQENSSFLRERRQHWHLPRKEVFVLATPQLAEMNRTRKRSARQFADQHSNLIWSLRNKGKTLREICSVLNDAGITTARGGVFHQSRSLESFDVLLRLLPDEIRTPTGITDVYGTHCCLCSPPPASQRDLHCLPPH